MNIDPNAIISSPAPALFLALVFLGLVITGVLVRGKDLDRALLANEGMRQSLDKLTVAFDRRSDIEEDRLRTEKDQAARRERRRGSD